VTKFISIGDEVVRSAGAFAGLVGRVVATKPKNTPWSSHIKVDADISGYTGRERDKVRLLINNWSSVASWNLRSE
jgi:hypothetical protein